LAHHLEKNGSKFIRQIIFFEVIMCKVMPEEGGIPQFRNNNPFQECVLLRALTSVKLDPLIDEG
jgi:hypothetical protein